MIPTVTRGLRETAVTTENLAPWARNELLPFLAQLRQVLNYTSVNSPPQFTTTGTGVMTTVWTSADIASGQAVIIDATIVGRAAAQRSAFKITGFFYNTGAGTAQEGATAAPYTQNTAGFAVQYAVSGNGVVLQVQDAGGLTVVWDALVEAQEVT